MSATFRSRIESEHRNLENMLAENHKYRDSPWWDSVYAARQVTSWLLDGNAAPSKMLTSKPFKNRRTTRLRARSKAEE